MSETQPQQDPRVSSTQQEEEEKKEMKVNAFWLFCLSIFTATGILYTFGLCILQANQPHVWTYDYSAIQNFTIPNVFPSDLLRIPPLYPTAIHPSDRQKDYPYDTTFRRGVCSFHLRLFQQCVAAPLGAETATTGFLYSIDDYWNMTFVEFADGLGRLDGAENVKRVVGLGLRPNLFLKYMEGVAHFKFAECLWDGVTGDYQFRDWTLCSGCNAERWTDGGRIFEGPLEDDSVCLKNGTMGASRFLDMDCSYKC